MGDSGETLLVRAEQDSSGDATLFLNPLRFQPDAAMRLLIPASDERAGPAHLAARGKNGVIQSIDYRGVPVLAAYGYLPEIGWGFVAKQDLAEAFQPVRRVTTLWALVTAVVLSLAAAVAVGSAAHLTHPVERLAASARAAAAGEGPTWSPTSSAGDPEAGAMQRERFPVDRTDEIGALARAMRTMLTAVRDREAQLRTHAEELQLLNDLGISMSRSLDLSDIARHVVAVVARHFTTAVAQLLLYDESGGELMKYASAGTVTASLTPLRRTALGEGPLGSAAAMRETRVERSPEPLLLPSYVFGGTPRVVVDVPLVRRSAPLAVLAVASEDASAFDEEQIVLLETMAAQLAPAIESARLFRDLRASYDHTLDALVAALDMRDKETEGHSQRVVAYSLRLARELGVRGGELTALRRGSLLHDIGKIGVPDAVLLKPGPLDDDERLIIQRHPELGVRVLRDIQFLASAIPVVGNHHERWDGDGYPRGLRGDAIPLGARIFGVVDTFDAITSDRPYAVAREEIVKGRGSQFDPSVVEAFLAVPEDEWSSLRQSVAARSDGRTPTDGQHPLLGQTAAVTLPADLQALNQLVTTTSNSLSLDDLLDQTAGALAHSLDARGVGAFVYDGTHDELVLAAQHGLPDTIVDRFQRFPVAGFHNEQVVRNAQVVLQPTEAVAAFRDMRLLQQHPAMQSYLCLPLVAKGEVCGVVGLLGTDGSFDGADEQLYRSIGEGVGLAIRNARLHESIQRLSTTDALTGALNRHQLDALLETEADRAARYRCPLAIALIDIDRFRDYNQRHGHNEGDAALRSIVSLMQATVRIPDSVARFGSEEFALVLPETDSPGAQRVAEKVRRAVQDHQFRAGPLTVSVGVAAIDPGESGSAASLVARGMRALEQAAGRNAVRADIAA